MSATEITKGTNFIVKLFENGQHNMPSFPILYTIANPSSSTMVVDTSIPSLEFDALLKVTFKR
jgi:hypothetical protein